MATTHLAQAVDVRPMARPGSAEADALIQRARELQPWLREQAVLHRRERRILPETIARLNEAGLFRVIQPRRYGGYEMSPEVFGQVLVLLAQADPSLGFAYGVIAVHSYHMGFYDERAAQDVWGEDDAVLIGSPYAPSGVARRVEGGYRLSGRWSFSSGCENCQWHFLGGMVEGEGEDGTVLERLKAFLVPRADARIVDNWHVVGLQGSGSKDIVVEDAFVPDYRVETFPIADWSAHPGTAINPGGLFRVPFLPLFTRAVSSAALGALEGMIDYFSGYTAERLNVLSQRVARDPVVQAALGQARATADMLRTVFERDLAEMCRIGELGIRIDPERFNLFLLQSANVPHLAQAAALDLVRAAGANGIRQDHALGTFHSDILVIGQHSSNTPRTWATNLGQMLLGLAPQA